MVKLVRTEQTELLNVTCPDCGLMHVFFIGKTGRPVIMTSGQHKHLSYAADKLGVSLDKVKKDGIIACKCGCVIQPYMDIDNHI